MGRSATRDWWRGLAVAMLLTARIALAASPSSVEPRFRHLGTAEGLSHDVIYGIVQDWRGFLWIGTEDGLDRYDGFEFVHYGRRDGLPADDVSCLSLGRDGTIWIGTWGAGVATLDPLRGTIKPLTLPGKTQLTDGRIHSIYEAMDGSIWIGTFSGLNRVARNRQSITKMFARQGDDDSLSADRIWSIAEDRGGSIWLGTDHGLDRLDPVTGRIHAYFHDPADPSSLSDDLVRVLALDREGALWVGTGAGLDRFDASTDRFRSWHPDPSNPASLSHDVITAIEKDAGGAIWVGTFGGGVNRFDPRTGVFTRYLPDLQDPTALSHANVRSLLVDRSSVLWVGTRSGGLNALDLKPRKFAERRYGTRDQDLPRPEVLSILGSRDGSLWVGMLGALARYTPDGRRVVLTRDATSPVRLGYDTIAALAEDSDGTLWIGTTLGLEALRPGARAVESRRAAAIDPGTIPDDGVEALLVDRSGVLWVGTRKGLCRLDRARNVFVREVTVLPHEPEPIWVRSILEDGRGRIWIATEVSGLLRFDPASKTLERWGVGPGAAALDSNRVFAIERDARGVIWAGTTNGLSWLDAASGKFVPERLATGVRRSAAIYSIRGDAKGHLWLGTPHGLLRYDVSTRQVREYDESDGLYSKGFSRNASAVTKDGDFYFGAKDGLVRFRPDLMRDNAQPPAVQLVSMTINGDTDYSPAARGVLELPPGRYDIRFRFAALDFNSPLSNRYRYRLAGFEDNWSDGGNEPNVSYRGLPPGRFTLWVRAGNSDLVWSEARPLITVVIAPPFWGTWWFRGVLAVAVLALAWLVVRWRIRALIRRRDELEHLVDERTAQLASANSALERLASTDGLTGLANHRTFQDALRTEWRRAHRAGSTMSLLMLDVDNFKAFNDLYGHPAGDDCLRRIGATIRELARRSSDVAARWGGEEFAVLLPDTDGTAALTIAESLRSGIRQLGIPHSGSAAGAVTASIGVASVAPSESTTIEQLVSAADAALYAAKAAGRNQVVSQRA